MASRERPRRKPNVDIYKEGRLAQNTGWTNSSR
jgi:hypothetical protein